ncbi:Conserved hypothetical protein [Candidatus Phytoplasma australiense]|uniref:Uncharacterized protein n=1 Tax=Phytoplasma australiense TaxID=59748 RepID=B1V9P2_PHYAS|nr:Conserved hypothetical protein [Candidatus Phytoplasma australiense]
MSNPFKTLNCMRINKTTERRKLMTPQFRRNATWFFAILALLGMIFISYRLFNTNRTQDPQAGGSEALRHQTQTEAERKAAETNQPQANTGSQE